MYIGGIFDPFGHWGNVPEVPDNDDDDNGIEERMSSQYTFSLGAAVVAILGFVTVILIALIAEYICEVF